VKLKTIDNKTYPLDQVVLINDDDEEIITVEDLLKQQKHEQSLIALSNLTIETFCNILTDLGIKNPRSIFLNLTSLVNQVTYREDHTDQ
jgi:hypothetical protein